MSHQEIVARTDELTDFLVDTEYPLSWERRLHDDGFAFLFGVHVQVLRIRVSYDAIDFSA